MSSSRSIFAHRLHRHLLVLDLQLHNPTTTIGRIVFRRLPIEALHSDDLVIEAFDLRKALLVSARTRVAESDGADTLRLAVVADTNLGNVRRTRRPE